MIRGNRIARELQESADLMRRCGDVLHDEIGRVADALIACYEAGGKVLFCGNGGSAADSQHLATELVARYQQDRPGLPAIALTTDSSLLTAMGNDAGFEFIFARQVEALGRPGDILFALSTSGQ